MTIDLSGISAEAAWPSLHMHPTPDMSMILMRKDYEWDGDWLKLREFQARSIEESLDGGPNFLAAENLKAPTDIYQILPYSLGIDGWVDELDSVEMIIQGYDAHAVPDNLEMPNEQLSPLPFSFELARSQHTNTLATDSLAEFLVAASHDLSSTDAFFIANAGWAQFIRMDEVQPDLKTDLSVITMMLGYMGTFHGKPLYANIDPTSKVEKGEAFQVWTKS